MGCGELPKARNREQPAKQKILKIPEINTPPLRIHSCAVQDSAVTLSALLGHSTLSQPQDQGPIVALQVPRSA